MEVAGNYNRHSFEQEKTKKRNFRTTPQEAKGVLGYSPGEQRPKIKILFYL